MEDLVKEYKLSNGLRVWLSPDSTDSKVYGYVVVQAGAKDSPNSGIAHYFEHIMFKGTQSIGTVDYMSEAPILCEIERQYSLLKVAQSDEERATIQGEINRLNRLASQYAIPNDFNNLIAKYGGSGLNAGTSYDYTLFFNSFSPEYLEHWCEMNSERLIDPVFRLFQSELETVYEEKNMYADNIATAAIERIFERVATPHPYRYPIIGSTEALKQPDMEAMKHFFNTYYNAGNMALILVGDFGDRDILPLLERTFGKIRAGMPTMRSLTPPKPFSGHEKMSIKLPIPWVQGAGYIWHTVPNNHPDQIALSLIGALLNNSSKTGLLDKLTIDNKVAEAAAINFALNDMGILGIYIVPKLLQSSFSAKRKVLKALKQITTGAFSDEQLEEVKLSIYKSYIPQLESSEKRAKLLAMTFAQGDTWESFLKDLDKLRSITHNEVIRVAKKYINENCLEINKRFGRYPKEKLARPPYQPVEAPNRGKKSAFARYLEGLDVPTLPAKYLDFDKDMERMPLTEKGLAQLFRVSNDANDLFTLDLLYFRQPYLHPTQQLLDYYLDLVGGNGMKAHELNNQLQKLGASVSYESKDSFFVVGITGFDKYFSETIELIGLFLNRVGVEQKAIKKIAENKKINENTEKSDLPTLSKRLFDRARYGKEAPYRVELPSRKIRRLKAIDAVNELQQLLQSEVDVHYTGGLSMEKITPLVIKNFNISEIRQAGEGYFYKMASLPPHDQIHYTQVAFATQTIVKAYIPLGTLTKKEEVALRVLASYLGGGMGSLLFQEIREYRSLAYSVNCFATIPPATIKDGKAELIINLGTQADKLVEAVLLLKELVYKKPEDISRFENTIESLISSARSFYPTLRMRSRTIVSQIRQGYNKDISLTFQEELKEITLADIIGFHQNRVINTPISISVIGNISSSDIRQLSQHFRMIEVPKSELL